MNSLTRPLIRPILDSPGIVIATLIALKNHKATERRAHAIAREGQAPSSGSAMEHLFSRVKQEELIQTAAIAGATRPTKR